MLRALSCQVWKWDVKERCLSTSACVLVWTRRLQR